MKKYIKPSIKVRTIATESILAASDLFNNTPDSVTMDVKDDTTIGTSQIGAKKSFMSWEDEEEQ